MPLADGILGSMADASLLGEIAEQADPEYLRVHTIALTVNRPLELVANELSGNDLPTMWDIWLIQRQGENFGYVNDDVYQMMVEQAQQQTVQ